MLIAEDTRMPCDACGAPTTGWRCSGCRDLVPCDVCGDYLDPEEDEDHLSRCPTTYDTCDGCEAEVELGTLAASSQYERTSLCPACIQEEAP